MHQIKTLLEANPNVSSISLDFQNIRDLTLCVRLLQKFPNLRTLSLHGNHLNKLPLMSQLKIVTLDLSNNPLQIDNFLLDGLFSLSSLQNLSIDGSEADIQRILENLPNLKTINKKKVVREKLADKKNDLGERMKISLKQEKEKIKEMAKNILEKFQFYQPETLNTFDTSFSQIFEQYRNFTQNITIDTAKQGVFLYSKNKLVDILQQKLINTLSQHKLQHIADAIEDIGILKKQYFDSLLRIVLQVGYDQCCLEDDLGDQINTEMKNIKLRKERLYLKEIMRLKKKINDYRTYLHKLQEENSKHVHALYSLTRGNIEQLPQNNQKNKLQSKPLDLFPPRIFNKQKSPTPKNRGNITPSKSSQKLRDEAFTPHKTIQEKMLNRQTSTSKVLLSYDQTINLMEEFISSKHMQNQKARKKKEAFQTSEEYLSTFFTSKYGVKTIAINWSLNFIRSLQVYAKQNSLCETFLKILKHSIQQSFYEQHIKFIQNLKQDMHQIKQEEEISQSDAENMFLRYFPTEDLDQFKIITNVGHLNPDTIFKQLCKTHIKTHERLLSEFSNLFHQFDTDEDGSLTLEQAKQFVTQFFNPKIQKAIVTHGIIEKVVKKLDPYKKNKIIFSELVDIVDKII